MNWQSFCTLLIDVNIFFHYVKSTTRIRWNKEMNLNHSQNIKIDFHFLLHIMINEVQLVLFRVLQIVINLIHFYGVAIGNYFFNRLQISWFIYCLY